MCILFPPFRHSMGRALHCSGVATFAYRVVCAQRGSSLRTLTRTCNCTATRGSCLERFAPYAMRALHGSWPTLFFAQWFPRSDSRTVRSQRSSRQACSVHKSVSVQPGSYFGQSIGSMRRYNLVRAQRGFRHLQSARCANLALDGSRLAVLVPYAFRASRGSCLALCATYASRACRAVRAQGRSCTTLLTHSHIRTKRGWRTARFVHNANRAHHVWPSEI